MKIEATYKGTQRGEYLTPGRVYKLDLDAYGLRDGEISVSNFGDGFAMTYSDVMKMLMEWENISGIVEEENGPE